MFQKSLINDRIILLTDEMSDVHSVSVGLLVRIGSCSESKDVRGISHFVEHLLFKGTKMRSAARIAREIDGVGGHLNGSTGREFSYYYARVRDKDLSLALDILSDIYLNSTFLPEEVEKERSVILQEISMIEDTPDEYIHELLHQALFTNSFGEPIYGNPETIRDMSRDSIVKYFDETYKETRIIIGGSGRLKHDQFRDLVEDYFLHPDGWGKLNSKVKLKETDKPGFRISKKFEDRDLEQMHLCLGFEALSQVDQRRYMLYIINTYLGGGMSSRLFQEVREERGLAYNIYSFLSSYLEGGYLGVYVGIDPSNTDEVVDIILREIEKIKTGGITKDNLVRVKEQIKGQFLLSLESTHSRMNKLLKDEFSFNRNIDVEEVIESIDRVKEDEILELCQSLFKDGDYSLALLGPGRDLNSNYIKNIT